MMSEKVGPQHLRRKAMLLARAYDLLQESELERPFRGVECGYLQLRSVGTDTPALVTDHKKRLPRDQDSELEYRQALGAVA